LGQGAELPRLIVETWQPLQVGEAILLKAGEIVRRRAGRGEPG
jgi:hypothetical protein